MHIYIVVQLFRSASHEMMLPVRFVSEIFSLYFNFCEIVGEAPGECQSE